MSTSGNPSTESNPSTPPNPDEPSRQRDQQDREIAAGITEAKHTITLLQQDTEVRSALGKRGYDTKEVNTGASLQIAAQATFNDRQQAIGEQEACSAQLNEAVTTARVGYADFRRVARAKFKAQADRTKLGLTGTVPNELQKFITLATASYTEAGNEPYQVVLAKKGYDAAALEKLLEGLADIDAAVKTHRQAASAAQAATRQRDVAYGVLKNWMGELRATAQVAFRDAPEQAKKLDF